MEEHPNFPEIKRWKLESGLDLRKIPPNTILSVETNNSVYMIKKIKDREIEITGGMQKDGEDRFPAPTQAFLVGSTFGGSMIKLDWLGHDMNMEVHILKEDGASIFLTSCIRNVTVESPDGSWSYSMDWNE
jgi:hypothetical protein